MDPGDEEQLKEIFTLDISDIGERGRRAKPVRSILGAPPEWVEKSVAMYLDEAPSYSVKSLSYTKPELRNRLKNQIMAGSRGGRPGQWSARKAQLLAQEYRKRGGGYRGGLRKTQRSLRRWTREKWTTSDGKPANRPGGMRRYLPASAWRRLTPAQRQATNRKKIIGDSRGRQFVANTERAREVGARVRRSRG